MDINYPSRNDRYGAGWKHAASDPRPGLSPRGSGRWLRWLGCIAAALAAGLHASATVIPGEPAYVKSLDGSWRFRLEQPGGYDAAAGIGRQPMAVTTPAPFEPFQQPDYKEAKGWVDLKVPANWEMAGLSPATYKEPDNASGFYRVWFTVPNDWKGRPVRLNFDGVQNGAELWLNGQPVAVDEPSWGRANYHEGGWTAFEADLTPAVKFGKKNLLAVRVTKNTRSSDLDSGDYFFLGGIHRTVTLFSVPKTHLADITVQTRLVQGSRAEVKVLADVAGGDASNVSMQLEGVPGTVTAKIESGHAVLTMIVEQPKLWSAEFPNLYTLRVELVDARQKPLETATKRIGIREVSIKNSVLLVNDVPVKLAGVCRHDVSAKEGTAVGPALWRKDIALMKAANVNAIRTSHYPYGSGFYDLCDELGMYVADELPYCWCPTGNAETRPAFEQRARETVRRDKNHPSVIIWAIGNENKAGRNLQVIADLVKEMDGTRPRAVSCFNASRYKVELSDSHYNTPAQMANGDAASRTSGAPHIYLETPNSSDMRLGADAGAYEHWGPVIQRTWDACLKCDTIPGVFLFEWQDRAIADGSPTKYYHYFPETGINLLKMKGIVDAFRNPRPSHYELKMAYTPIRIGDAATASGGRISFPVDNRYSFTDLSYLKMSWALEREGKVIVAGNSHARQAPLTTGRIEVAVPPHALGQADAFRVEFVHPDGNCVVAHRFTLKETPVVSRLNPALPAGLPIPQFNLITRVTQRHPTLWREVIRFPAHLTNVVVEPASATTLAEMRQLTAEVIGGTNKQVVGRVRAEYSGGGFSYQFDWTAVQADVQELGWVFQLPKNCDRFSWDRASRWTVYPPSHIARAAGTATPDTMKAAYTRMERPDAFDFNSTKYDCNWASLTTAKGAGLRVEFDAAQRFHCRGGAAAGGAGYTLFVNQQVSPQDDYVKNIAGDLLMVLEAGDSIKGRFRVGSNSAIAHD
jgi:beta-galactosidase